MASLWLVRAGKHGEHEEKFLGDGKIYATWDIKHDLKGLNRNGILEILQKRYPGESKERLAHHARQLYAFVSIMKKDEDYFVLPSKLEKEIYVGKITGDYQFNPKAKVPYYHSRKVEYFQAVPRTHFKQDLLYSFGAFSTICAVSRNDAVKRFGAMMQNNWESERDEASTKDQETEMSMSDAGIKKLTEDSIMSDAGIKELAEDSIVKRIEEKFSGHDFPRLIKGILEAKGYKVFQTPDQKDKGADLLVSRDALGFDNQFGICVEVKSGNTPAGSKIVDQLIGARDKYNAKFALLVSWGGFKKGVRREYMEKYFVLRLWSQRDVLRELYDCYDNLSEEIKAELPLERIWSVIQED